MTGITGFVDGFICLVLFQPLDGRNRFFKGFTKSVMSVWNSSKTLELIIADLGCHELIIADVTNDMFINKSKPAGSFGDALFNRLIIS